MGKQPLITAAELDDMTPDERASEFNKRVVTDITVMPLAFQHRVQATAQRLADERNQLRNS